MISFYHIQLQPNTDCITTSRGLSQKAKKEENVLQNILHLEQHIFCNTCASSNKSKSTWVVFTYKLTAVCSCTFQVSFTISDSIDTTTYQRNWQELTNKEFNSLSREYSKKYS